MKFSDKDLRKAYEEYVENCQPMAGNFGYFKEKVENNEEFARRWDLIKKRDVKN